VLCHSSSPERCEKLKEEGLATTQLLSDGLYRSLWIVGKYDPRVQKFLPEGATVIVFSVPNPFVRFPRTDARIIEGATLRLNPSSLDQPRVFANLMAHDEIFACNAAALVHAFKGTGVDEVGEVDPDSLDQWLRDAEEVGIYRPQHTTPPDVRRPSQKDNVIVVGGGPSGLATAASLKRRGVNCVVLEIQSSLQGSWLSHFSSLEVTTRRDHCSLPGFPMPAEVFPNESITAEDYVRYLTMYAARFSLDVRLGAEVTDVQELPEKAHWRVRCSSGEEHVAQSVVIATGCHRKLRKPSTFCQLDEEVVVLHSAELRGAELWHKATQAALAGELLIVGFGNSTSDVCSGILRCANSADPGKACVHISVRRVPTIIPRQYGPLRAEVVALGLRRLPSSWADIVVGLFARFLGGSLVQKFPPHLQRVAPAQEGKIPVIDKYGIVKEGILSGQLRLHGKVVEASGKSVSLEDAPGIRGLPVHVSMVILCTGYEERPTLAPKAHPKRGIYHVGFADPWLLPLRRIGEEAEATAASICASLA